MADVLFTVILLGLVASFSPVIIATTATQLTRSSPVARAIAVVAGVAMATALLELMALGLLAGVKALLSGGNYRAIRIGFDLVIGGFLFVVFVRLWRGTHDKTPPRKTSTSELENEEGSRGLKRLFILGFTLMFFNAKAFLLITGAVTQIRALNTLLEVALLLVILYVVVNFLPSAPLIAYLISPAMAAKVPEFTTWSIEQSKPAVAKAESAKRWLLTDQRTWVQLLTLVAGLLLIARGMSLWVG
jgi:threonine/homoserine/homoserine lactone efflux protein